jgi:hypothetical protein
MNKKKTEQKLREKERASETRIPTKPSPLMSLKYYSGGVGRRKVSGKKKKEVLLKKKKGFIRSQNAVVIVDGWMGMGGGAF